VNRSRPRIRAAAEPAAAPRSEAGVASFRRRAVPGGLFRTWLGRRTCPKPGPGQICAAEDKRKTAPERGFLESPPPGLEPATVGISGARLYDLRHAFASLLIHEGRLSALDIAAQLGHNPTVCLDTYAHVMAEQCGSEPISSEAEIATARTASCAPSAATRGENLQLSFAGCD
jgi:hypothetical protein